MYKWIDGNIDSVHRSDIDGKHRFSYRDYIFIEIEIDRKVDNEYTVYNK